MSKRIQKLIKTPKGTRDFSSSDLSMRNRIIETIRSTFDLYSGQQIETPIIETFETVKSLYGDGFNKEVYYIESNEQEEKLLLRYDLTVPVSRFVVSNGGQNSKLYQIGKAFRRDTPQIYLGRLCEFVQCDFDIFGSDSNTLIQDTEILCLLRRVLNNTIGKNTFKIKVNDKQLLYDVLERTIGIEDMFPSVCSSLDKIDKIGWTKVKIELLDRGLDFYQLEQIIEFYKIASSSKDKFVILERLLNAKLISRDSFDKNMKLFDYLEDLNFGEQIEFDPLLARGLDYYTGTIYEAVYNDKNVIASTIASGGRYDSLLEKLGNKGQIPAIGLSIGLERIMVIINKTRSISKEIVQNDIDDQIFVATVGKNMELHKLILAEMLRDLGFVVHYVYKKNPKMRPQLNYVLERRIRYMITIGENEIKENKVTIKNINTKSQITIDRNPEQIYAFVRDIM